MANTNVVLDKIDNVATSLIDMKGGQEVKINIDNKNKKVVVKVDIEFGHKFAVADIVKGENVIKYGQIIGMASEDIKTGDFVHVHNLKSKRGRGDLQKGATN